MAKGNAKNAPEIFQADGCTFWQQALVDFAEPRCHISLMTTLCTAPKICSRGGISEYGGSTECLTIVVLWLL